MATPGRLRPEDVDAVRFSTVRLVQGYDEAEVDDFLSEIREDLRLRLYVLERRPDQAGRERALARLRLTAGSVEAKTFTMVRLREGYDPEDVDAFLDTVIAEFRALDRALRAPS